MPGSLADYAVLAFEAIEDLDRLQTPDQVIVRMGAVLATFGYTGFLITSTPDADAADQRQTFLDGWPSRFNDHYIEQGFYKDDPVAAWCRRACDPFEWSEVHYDKAEWPTAARVMGAAGEIGLKKGFSIPIFRTDDLRDTVSMAGECPEFDPLAKRAIHLIGLYAHAKVMSLVAGPQLPKKRVLSDAEREAMTWVAAGKSSWEISMILGISESAVIKRISNAMTKLDAVNRIQAAVKAVHLREVNP
jgi:LuxR family quorum sensing-dependent transcriptional regulator